MSRKEALSVLTAQSRSLSLILTKENAFPAKKDRNSTPRLTNARRAPTVNKVKSGMKTLRNASKLATVHPTMFGMNSNRSARVQRIFPSILDVNV